MGGKRYVAIGLNMVDHIIYADGSDTFFMGGIPVYGFAGMRLWVRPEEIAFAARCGRDFFSHYDPWFHNNGADAADLVYVSDQTPYNDIYYNENFDMTQCTFFTGDFRDSNLWRPHPEDIGRWIGEGTRGVYCCGPPDAPMWDAVFAQKARRPFSVMWEPNYISTFPEKRAATLALCRRIEMASFNVPEGCRIFGLADEQALLGFLKTMGTPMVLLRCGARGLYVIAGGRARFVPSAGVPRGHRVVDTTGCGNTSTAGACVAWCEGKDALMTGIMANISSSYTLCQKGPWPLYTDALCAEAAAHAQELYDKLKGDDNYV